MFGAVADTHAVIWYLLDSPRLSNKPLRSLRDVKQMECWSEHPA